MGLYKLRATIPAAEAFRPLKEGGCPLVQRLKLSSPRRTRREATTAQSELPG